MSAVANYFKLSSLAQARPQIPINAAANFEAKILTDVNSKRQVSEIFNISLTCLLLLSASLPAKTGRFVASENYF